jgi:hypothetical protein
LLEYSSLNELEILFKKIYDSDSLYKQWLEKFLYRENLYNNSETYIVPDSIDAMSRDERKRFYTQMIQKEYLLRNRTSVNQEYFIETVWFLDDSELEWFYYSFFSTEKEAHMAILSYSKELFWVDWTNISPNLTLWSIIDIIGVDQYWKESILHVTLITNIFEKK